jgi:hypothetical protein
MKTDAGLAVAAVRKRGGMSSPRACRGAALTETVISLLVFVPFMIAIPLLGKQLDVKHKTFDASRYSAWERTVWRSSGPTNTKSAEEIALEARDRTLGNQRAGIVPLAQLRARGVTENVLWKDHTGRRLLDYRTEAPVTGSLGEQSSPRDVGVALVPALTHGIGSTAAAPLKALDIDNLNLPQRTYASASVSVALRPVLLQRAERSIGLGPQKNSQADDGKRRGELAALMQSAKGSILSDSWSVQSNEQFRGRVDNITLDDAARVIELPGLILGINPFGKGAPMLGEALYGLDADIKPSADALPRNYVGPPRQR